MSITRGCLLCGVVYLPVQNCQTQSDLDAVCYTLWATLSRRPPPDLSTAHVTSSSSLAELKMYKMHISFTSPCTTLYRAATMTWWYSCVQYRFSPFDSQRCRPTEISSHLKTTVMKTIRTRRIPAPLLSAPLPSRWRKWRTRARLRLDRMVWLAWRRWTAAWHHPKSDWWSTVVT